MEIRHCRYFVAVAEELHFGRAASRLGISQPPLSQQIRSLEEELGVELLRRTKRSVRLTPAGSVFLQAARRLLRGIEDSVDVARRAARGEVGTLQLGYAPGAEIDILPRLLAAFYKRYPDVHVRIVPLPTPEQIESLKQGRIDVGLVVLPASTGGLVVRPIRKEPLVLVLPRNHPLARKSSLNVKDLNGVPYIQLARAYEPAYTDHVLALARTARIALKVVSESAHLYDTLSQVSAGMGVSLLPRFVRLVRRPGIAYRPIRTPGAGLEIGVASRTREFSQVILEFVRVVHRLYSGRPGGR